MQQFQQHLFRKVWAKHTIKKQELKDFMIIKGNIINVVILKDINVNVPLNQEVSLTETQVKQSRDLENAIRRNWVQVILDKNTRIDNNRVLPPAPAQIQIAQQQVQQVPQQQQMNNDQIMDMAKNMASSMAEEMIKNSPLVKEIAKELAQQMLAGIKDNLKIEHVVMQGNQGSQTVPVTIQEPENNVFIDFGNDEVKTESSIADLGTVEVKNDNLSSSLEKMKRFKRST